MDGLVGTVSDFCLCWFCCFCLLISVNYCLSNPLIRSHWKNEVGHHKDSLKISYLELEFLSFNIPDRDFSYEFFKLGTRSDWTFHTFQHRTGISGRPVRFDFLKIGTRSELWKCQNDKYNVKYEYMNSADCNITWPNCNQLIG